MRPDEAPLSWGSSDNTRGENNINETVSIAIDNGMISLEDHQIQVKSCAASSSVNRRNFYLKLCCLLLVANQRLILDVAKL